MEVGFDLYKVFYFVCEFKSVTKAANYLCVSQPAITKHIKNLESLVGANLIMKVPKGIELTDKGKDLYNEIEEPISKLISLEFRNMSKKSVLKISAGYSITDRYLLSPMIELNKEYPNLRISLGNFYYRDSVQRLRDGKLDLIFLNLRPNYDFAGDLIAKDFCELHDIFVISSKEKDKYPSRVKLLDLVKYPIICKYGVSNSRFFLENYFSQNGGSFEVRYNVSNHFLIEKYAEEGLGIGLVTKEFVQDKLDSGELIEVEMDVKLPVRKIVYVIRKNNRYNDILSEFINKINSYKNEI